MLVKTMETLRSLVVETRNAHEAMNCAIAAYNQGIMPAAEMMGYKQKYRALDRELRSMTKRNVHRQIEKELKAKYGQT